MKKNPIVIMAAMDVEADFLIKKLENMTYETIEKYEFYEGTIEDYPIVICRCYVGTINASIATFISIEKYQPIAILSQGTAGAHGKNIHTGDLVIGEKCVNIVSCKTPYKKEGEGSNSLEWKLLKFISGEQDRLEYQLGDKHFIELAKKIPFPNGKVHFGTLGSGDIWNQETDKILWLHQNYATLCEDMESIAIYTVANRYKIPVIGVRVISNNEILGEPYLRTTGLKSQEFCYQLILEIVKNASS